MVKVCKLKKSYKNLTPGSAQKLLNDGGFSTLAQGLGDSEKKTQRSFSTFAAFQ